MQSISYLYKEQLIFKSIGFIGAGRVAHIMLGGWQKANTRLGSVRVYDPSPEALDALKKAFPAIEVASEAEAAGQSLVFLAVHPPMMEALLARIAPVLKSDAVVVSLAPRVRFPALQAKLGGFSRVARMNPNAPSIVGAGFNPVSFASGLPSDARAALLALMAPLGDSPEVDDALIEVCAVISAMGPTYFWFQFETIRQLAGEFGMSPELAQDAVRRMLHGAVETLFDGSLPPERVMDLVPVKPLAPDEAAIIGMLRDRVGAIHAKLTA